MLAEKGIGRRKVSAIQDVEKLRPELQAGALRNLPDREVLVDREIQVEEPRAENAIAAGVAQKIRAIDRSGRRRGGGFWKTAALGGKRSRRSGKREATVVDVTEENSARITLEIMVCGIASRHAIRNTESIGAVILHTHGVSPDEGSCGNPTIQFDDTAQFPSVHEHASRPVEGLGPGHIPDAIDRRAVSNVEVRDGATDLGGEPEPTGDGIGKGIASDGRGIVIHRLAVSVGPSELEAVGHPLLDVHLKA